MSDEETIFNHIISKLGKKYTSTIITRTNFFVKKNKNKKELMLFSLEHKAKRNIQNFIKTDGFVRGITTQFYADIIIEIHEDEINIAKIRSKPRASFNLSNPKCFDELLAYINT